jgi:hypothetical protein
LQTELAIDSFCSYFVEQYICSVLQLRPTSLFWIGDRAILLAAGLFR